MSKTRVWVTKWALTRGIIAVDADLIEERVAGDPVTYAVFRWPGGVVVKTRDFERTRAAAFATAEAMRKSKAAGYRRLAARVERESTRCFEIEDQVKL